MSKLSRQWALLVALTVAVLPLGCAFPYEKISSGQIGCPPRQIVITDRAGGASSPRTWTATCGSRTFYCSETGSGYVYGESYGSAHQYSCSVASVAPAPAPSGSTRGSAPIGGGRANDSGQPTGAQKPATFPKAALGFTFGSAVADAQEACTRQGHEWTQEGEGFSCSGAAADVGLPVHTQLSFCRDELCELQVFATLGKGEEGTKQFVKLRKGLRSQYGDPDKERSQVPQECQRSLMSCLVTGKATWSASWEWRDGSKIKAKAASDGEVPIVGIAYRRGEALQEERSKKPAKSRAESEPELNADAF